MSISDNEGYVGQQRGPKKIVYYFIVMKKPLV